MADVQSLLPPRASTPVLRAIEQAIAYEPRVVPGVDLIRDIKGRRLPAWLQFLLYEYGLIELTPYVTNPYILLDEGRIWQIERDTFAAVLRGLGWVSSPGTIIEAPERRFWWNSFQIYLDSLPPLDDPNLIRIERVVTLSKPYRSDFRRGVFEYDAQPLEGDMTKLDASLLEFESGVRLHAGGPLWSFGRSMEWTHTLEESEGLALGNWLALPNDAEFLAIMTGLTAYIGGDPVPFEEAVGFARASKKWHDDNAGAWHEFEIDEIAATDRGSLIEVEATRVCLFLPQENPLTIDFFDGIEAALIEAAGVSDPFGGEEAIRVKFSTAFVKDFDGSPIVDEDGNFVRECGNTLLIPAEGLEDDTEYSVSFFARFVSAENVGGDDEDGGFQDVLGQLLPGEWKRIVGVPITTGLVMGQWIDLTLTGSDATLIIDLFGFQIEAGSKVTSPIYGDNINDTRAADEVTLFLPPGSNNVVVKFWDNTAHAFLLIEGPYLIDPADLENPLVITISNAGAGTWLTMPFPWVDADFPWNSDVDTLRQTVLASWFEERPAYIALLDDEDDVIGYRRARAVRPVLEQSGGPFLVDGTGYVGADGGRSVFIEAMTAAGDGAGKVAKSAEIIFNATLADGVKPGALWLEPDDFVSGVAIATTDIDIPLRATVRDRLKLLLRF